MNPYATLGSGVGTEEAASLCARLNAWHDSMVAHERRLRASRTSAACDEDCPHVEARTLWAEALVTFGERANDLTFLRSRAMVVSESAESIPATPTRSETIRTRTRESGTSFGHGEPPEVTDGPVEAIDRARRGVATMTIRNVLGDDERLVHQLVDDLLDKEDGLIVLFDGDRMVSYSQGLGVSPCQLELLTVEIERFVRNVIGARSTTSRRSRGNGEKSGQGNNRGVGTVLRQHLGRSGSDHRRVADRGSESVRSGFFRKE